MTKDSQQSYQHIYIDDSGDPGFKIARNSSKCLVIAGVFLSGMEEIDLIHDELESFREELHWRSGREFKFHSMSDRERELFLREIKRLKVKICAFVADKAKSNLRDATTFYNQTISEVVGRASGEKLMIFIDGESGSNYRRKVKTYFRKMLPDKTICSLTYMDSKKSDPIQIADAVVGAVAAYYNRGHEKYLKIIKSCIQLETQ